MTINHDSDLCPDYFNREPIARNMANMLVEQSASLISPAILCGSWGSGKSTHALRIKAHLEQQHAETVQCIYLDAFKCDHSDEPYGMILAALYDVAPEAEKKSLVEAIKKGKTALYYAYQSFHKKQEKKSNEINIDGDATETIEYHFRRSGIIIRDLYIYLCHLNCTPCNENQHKLISYE